VVCSFLRWQPFLRKEESFVVTAQSIVFYSWQSDLPNGTNRTFIENALKKAAKTIRDDATLEVEPVIDRDVEGVAGSPDISRTIFEKIERARVFVCDVSIINLGMQGRPTPNPNQGFNPLEGDAHLK